MTALTVVYSYHHGNTRKVANAIGSVIGSDVKSTFDTNINDLEKYNLIGFGAGIDSGRHYKELLDFANELPIVDKKSSTSAVQGEKKVKKDHAKLRGILTVKGYNIIDEFSCKGFNTNLFLKYFGGMNKNRPNAEDIENAKAFAVRIKQELF